MEKRKRSRGIQQEPDEQPGKCLVCKKKKSNLKSYLIEICRMPVSILLCPACFNKLLSESSCIFLENKD